MNKICRFEKSSANVIAKVFAKADIKILAGPGEIKFNVLKHISSSAFASFTPTDIHTITTTEINPDTINVIIRESIDKRIFDTLVYTKGEQTRAKQVHMDLTALFEMGSPELIIGADEISNAIDTHQLAGFITTTEHLFRLFSPHAAKVSDKVECLQGPTPYEIEIVGWTWLANVKPPKAI